MSYSAPASDKSNITEKNSSTQLNRKIRIVPLGMALGIALSLTFVLCVLFDLWFPDLAMNAAWAPLLPGFIWISWAGFFVGLIETFAYGWYAALLFVPLYNFLANRGSGTV